MLTWWVRKRITVYSSTGWLGCVHNARFLAEKRKLNEIEKYLIFIHLHGKIHAIHFQFAVLTRESYEIQELLTSTSKNLLKFHLLECLRTLLKFVIKFDTYLLIWRHSFFATPCIWMLSIFRVHRLRMITTKWEKLYDDEEKINVIYLWTMTRVTHTASNTLTYTDRNFVYKIYCESRWFYHMSAASLRLKAACARSPAMGSSYSRCFAVFHWLLWIKLYKSMRIYSQLLILYKWKDCVELIQVFSAIKAR